MVASNGLSTGMTLRVELLPKPSREVPRAVQAYLNSSRLRSLLIRADLTEPLSKHSQLGIAYAGGKVVAGATRLDIFRDPVIAIMGDSTAASIALVSELEQEDSGVIVIASEEEPLLLASGWLTKDRDLWMTRETVAQTVEQPAVPLKCTEHLTRLYEEIGSQYWWPEMLDLGHYVGVMENGVLVAAAGVDFVLQTESYAQVGNVATLPGARLRGYATACVRGVLASLHASGVKYSGLFANAQDEALLRFYARLGFVRSGAFRFVYRKPPDLGTLGGGAGECGQRTRG